MRVLFLGAPDSLIRQFLARSGETVEFRDAALPDGEIPLADFIVSHNYRYKVPAETVVRFPRRIVNCHISLLPWNRGAHPNLWSVLEGTPGGVTIHEMDARIDTGAILAQRAVTLDAAHDTFRTSYCRLQDVMSSLFEEQWPLIRSGEHTVRPQEGRGSTHRMRDLDRVKHLLPLGWDTPVKGLCGCLSEDPLG